MPTSLKAAPNSYFGPSGNAGNISNGHGVMIKKGGDNHLCIGDMFQ